jgi:4-amino-4-deoxy-L-arabinose transferase-like glycosyltransferase
MRAERILFAVAVALFLGFAAYHLGLPGLHYDEAFEALPAMQILLKQPVTTFRGNGVFVGGQLLPLMTQDYIGALNTYLAIPFFLLFGIQTISLRIMCVAIGLLTLGLTFWLAKALYSSTAAVLSALLLAVNPTFIFWSRQGVFVTSVTATIGLGVVLAWWTWWRTGARRYAFVGAFLLGLGLYAKLLFLWLIVALGLAVLLVNLGQLGRIRQRLNSGLGGWSLPAFVLGSAPLLLYNFQTGGTLSSVGGNLTTSYYGTNNLALLPNLAERLRQFASVLTASHFWYLGHSYANWLNLGLFVVALVIVGRAAMGPNRDGARRALFPFVVVAGVILASCATVSSLWVTHFAVVSPWPALAIAGAADLVIRANRQRPVWRQWSLVLILTVAITSATWVAEMVTDVRYHRALAMSGGLGTHSDAIQDLSTWLMDGERRHVPVVAMDWGIAAPLTFLTLGEVAPVEAFGYEWDTDSSFADRLDPFIENPASIYLWRAPDEIIFDRSSDFRELYEARGLEEDILEAFYERSGRPVLGATRLVAMGKALNPPQVPGGD